MTIGPVSHTINDLRRRTHLDRSLAARLMTPRARTQPNARAIYYHLQCAWYSSTIALTLALAYIYNLNHHRTVLPHQSYISLQSPCAAPSDSFDTSRRLHLPRRDPRPATSFLALEMYSWHTPGSNSRSMAFASRSTPLLYAIDTIDCTFLAHSVITISSCKFCPYARTHSHKDVPSPKKWEPKIWPNFSSTTLHTTCQGRYTRWSLHNTLHGFNLRTLRWIQSPSASEHTCQLSSSQGCFYESTSHQCAGKNSGSGHRIDYNPPPAWKLTCQPVKSVEVQTQLCDRCNLSSNRKSRRGIDTTPRVGH